VDGATPTPEVRASQEAKAAARRAIREVPATDRILNATAGFFRSGLTELPASMLEALAVYRAMAEARLATPEMRGLAEQWGIPTPPENQKLTPAHERALFAAGQDLRALGEKVFPTDPRLAEDFVSHILPSAVGSFGGYMALAAASGGATAPFLRGAGLSTRVAARAAAQMTSAGTAAAMQGAAQMYGEAIEAGVDESRAHQVATVGQLPGVIQVFPVMRAIGRYQPNLVRPFANRVAHAVQEGTLGAVEEAVVESIGQIGYNATARLMFDENRAWAEGVGMAAGAGGGAGFIASLVMASLGRRAGPDTRKVVADSRTAIAHYDQLLQSRLDPETGQPMTELEIAQIEEARGMLAEYVATYGEAAGDGATDAQDGAGAQEGTPEPRGPLEKLVARLQQRAPAAAPIPRRRVEEVLGPKRAEEARAQYVDPLTGLSNQTALTAARVRFDVPNPARELVVLDITELNALSRAVGQEGIDARLQEVAEVMRAEATAREIPARNLFRSGGRFVIEAPAGQGAAIGQAIAAAVPDAPIEGGAAPSRIRFAAASTLTAAQLRAKVRGDGGDGILVAPTPRQPAAVQAPPVVTPAAPAAVQAPVQAPAPAPIVATPAPASAPVEARPAPSGVDSVATVGARMEDPAASPPTVATPAETLSYDQLQALIDAREDAIEAAGGDPLAMPVTDPELAELYERRNRVLDAEDAAAFEAIAAQLPAGPAPAEAVRQLAQGLHQDALSRERMARAGGRGAPTLSPLRLEQILQQIYTSLLHAHSPGGHGYPGDFRHALEVARGSAAWGQTTRPLIEQTLGVLQAFGVSTPPVEAVAAAIDRVPGTAPPATSLSAAPVTSVTPAAPTPPAMSPRQQKAVELNTNRKAQNAARRVDAQLHAAALARLEALADPLGQTEEAREAAFQVTLVRAMDPKRLTDEDRTTLNILLGYGEAGVIVTPGQPLPPPTQPETLPAPWADRTVAPATTGRRQTVLFSGDGRKVETEYAVIEASELRASHTTDYAQRPGEEFPAEIQGRAYHGTRGTQAREYTEQLVAGFDPSRALDLGASAGTGPSVVTVSGIAVAGNGRLIAQQRLYAARPEAGAALRAEIVKQAAQFGVDPAVVAGMREPILVRRIVDPQVNQRDVNELRALNKSSDDAEGKAKDALSDAASRAVQFRQADQSITHFTETVREEDTIASYLDRADGATFLRLLVADGVITAAERGRFINVATGEATPEGKKLIERIFYATALGDPDVLARAPQLLLNKLDTSLPAIIQADRAAGWEIGHLVREALDFSAAARASGMTLRDFAGQVDFTRAPVAPAVYEMAEFLEKPKKALRAGFRRYAEQALSTVRQLESVDLFGFTPPTPADGYRALVQGQDGGDAVVREASPAYGGSPRFHSRLARTIENAPQEKMSRQQWAGYLDHRKGGFSAAEAEWVGLAQVLASIEGKTITRGQLLAALRTRAIRLLDVVLADDLPEMRAAKEALDNARAVHIRTSDRLSDVMSQHGYDQDEIASALRGGPTTTAYSGGVVAPAQGSLALLASVGDRARAVGFALRLYNIDLRADDVYNMRLDPELLRHRVTLEWERAESTQANPRRLPRGLDTLLTNHAEYVARYEAAISVPAVAAVQAAIDAHRPALRAFLDANAAWGRARAIGRPRYSTYATPGGREYREILVQLGEQSAEGPSMKHEPAPTAGRPGFYTVWDANGSKFGDYATDNAADAFAMAEEQGPTVVQRANRRDIFDISADTGRFTEGHFSLDFPNDLVFLRVSTRTDANTGDDVLFVDELQSDWAQKGRESGFMPLELHQEFEAHQDAYARALAEIVQDGRATGTGGHAAYELQEAAKTDPALAALLEERRRLFEARRATVEAIRAERSAERGGAYSGIPVPPSPYPTTSAWVTLGIQRAIAEAVRTGAPKVAFVRGERVADRYDLRQTVTTLAYHPQDRHLVAWDSDGDRVVSERLRPDQLPAYVGKEVAAALLAAPVYERVGPASSQLERELQAELNAAFGPPDPGTGYMTDEELSLWLTEAEERFDPSAPEAEPIYEAALARHGLRVTQWARDVGHGVPLTLIAHLSDGRSLVDYHGDLRVEPTFVGQQVLRGNELDIGGKGHIEFYNNVIVYAAQKYLKQLGLPSRLIDIDLGENIGTVKGFEITPEVAERVATEGQRVLERGPRYGETRDMFGGPEPATGPEQGQLFAENRGPQGISVAVANARAVVSALQGRVERGGASPSDVRRYNIAYSLLRSVAGEGLDATEVLARQQDAGKVAPADPYSGDLFADLDVPTGRQRLREQLSLTFGDPATARRVIAAVAALAGNRLQVSVPGLPTTQQRIAAVRAGRIAAYAWLDAVGHRVADNNGAIDYTNLYSLLRAFRHPSAEHMHLLVLVPVDGGGFEIRHHRRTTAGLLDTALMAHGDVAEAAAVAKRLGGTVVMAHNHPSGNPKPSPEDFAATRSAQQTVRQVGARWGGHLVIDHTEATLINEYGDPISYSLPNIVRDANEWTIENQPAHFKGPAAVAQWMLQNAATPEGRLDVLLLDTQHRIVALESRPMSELGSIAEWLPGLRREAAAHKAILSVRGRADFDAVARQVDDIPLSVLDVVEISKGVSAAGEGRISLKGADVTMTPVAEGAPLAERPADVWSATANLPNPGRSLALDELAEKYDALLSKGDISDGGPIEAEPAVLGGGATLEPLNTVQLVRLVTTAMGGERIMVKKMPSSRGWFSPSEGQIALNPKLGTNYVQFQKTLAHEIGHMVDWLSDQDIRRGNILGRLASLKRYMAETVDAMPTDPSRALTKADRAQLRKDAEKKVGPKPKPAAELKTWQAAVSAEYAVLLDAEIQARGLLKREVVHEELHELSRWWRPYDPATVPEGFRKYRQSSVEIYGDALSVFLSSPGTLQARAPIFFESFLEYFERKPEVKAAYEAIQATIQAGPVAVAEERSAELRGDYARGEDIIRDAEAKAKLEPQGMVAHLLQVVLDRGHPVVSAERRSIAAAAGRRPIQSDTQHAVKMALQEYWHADNAVRLYMMNVARDVHTPLHEAGLTPDDASEVMQMQRIAEGDRGGAAEEAKSVIMDLVQATDWPDARAQYIELGEKGDPNFDPQLLATAESGLLNPRGDTPDTARQQLAAIRVRLGDEKYNLLVKLVGRLRDHNYQITKEAAAVGVYNRELFDTKIEPNRHTYAPFAVLEYFEGRVPPGVKHQIGTLKAVAGTYTTSIMKSAALLRLIERQKVVISLMTRFEKDFPGMAGPVTAISKHHAETKPPPNRRNLHFMIDGKPHYVEVDGYIADVLERSDVGQLQRLTHTLGSRTYAVFHPLYVSWSLAWQVRNVVRDWKRTRKNLAVMHAGKSPLAQAFYAVYDYGTIAKAYAQTFNAARLHALRRDNDLVRAMLEDRAIGKSFHRFEPRTEDDTITRIMQRYGLLKPEAGRIKKGLRAIGSPIETVGVFQETWAKAAIYKLLGEKGITGKKRAYIVRNYIGTPDSSVRGLASETVNAVLMYSNVTIAGWRSDLEVATHPQTAAGYWLRSILDDFLPKAVMAAVAAGAFGDDMEEWLGLVPSYDKEKYLITPVPGGPLFQENERGDRKAVYLRIPHDDANRVLAATTWALLSGNRPGAVGHAASIFAGEFPGLTPVLGIPANWWQFGGGRNPYDAFRGREIIPRTEWDAGGWPRTKEMLRWTAGEFGIASQLSGRWVYGSPEESASTPMEKNLRSVPGLSALVRVSDRGANEERQWEVDTETRDRARVRTSLPRSVRRRVSERSRLNRLGVERLQPRELARREQLNAWFTGAYTPIVEELTRLRAEGPQDPATRAEYNRLIRELDATLDAPGGPGR